jgi:hypothetical protein
VFTTLLFGGPYISICILGKVPKFTLTHFISLISASVSSSLLLLCLPISLFPLAYPIKILHKYPLYPMRTVCPAPLLLDFIVLIIFSYEYLHMEVPHCVNFSVSLSYLLFLSFRSKHSSSALFSDTLNLCSHLRLKMFHFRVQQKNDDKKCWKINTN